MLTTHSHRRHLFRQSCMALVATAVVLGVYFAFARDKERRPRVTDPHPEGIIGIGYIQAGKTIVTTHRDSTIKFWDAKSGYQLPLIFRAKGPIQDLVTATQSTIIAGSGWQSSDLSAFLQLWDFGKGNELPTGEMLAGQFLALSPDGKTLVTSYAPSEHDTIVCNVSTGERITRLTAPCNQLRYTRDGKTLTTHWFSSHYTRTKLWDTKTWYEDGSVEGPVVSADKCWSAAVGMGGFHLYDRYHEPSYTFPARISGSAHLRFAAGDKLLVGTSPTVRPEGQPTGKLEPASDIYVWSVGTKKQVAKKHVPNVLIDQLAISPDGTQFATAGSDGTTDQGVVNLWPLPLKD